LAWGEKYLDKALKTGYGIFKKRPVGIFLSLDVIIGCVSKELV
jgi:hypothetical protein